MENGAGDERGRPGLPLSAFRDAGLGVLGYALFALLLAVAGVMTATAVRQGRPDDVAVSALGALLLLVVAVTPSEDGWHVFCSLLLFGLLFGWSALLLRGRARPPWLWAHLSAPAALVLVTGCHSYGLWQKGFILYLLLAANLRHHLLAPRSP